MLKISILIIIILFSNILLAQQTKIRGKIIDKNTKDAIPFVNISLQNTTDGTTSDVEGNFYLQTNKQSDTLIFSSVGFISQKIKINKLAYNELNIELVAEDFTLEEVTVKPTENPAWRIMRNIIDNKKYNNPDKLQTYSFETYNKIEFDISNINQDVKDYFNIKNFDFVFNQIDTSAETGKTYLPMIIYETISDFYFNKFPKLEKEIIKANEISGIENKSVTQFTGQMYVDVNIYSNFIEIFDRQFVSPFSDFWKLTYKYYLLDSTYIEGKHFYLISFKPQRKQEMTFYGEFWVHDTTWSVSKVKARISKDININLINDFIVQQEFSYTKLLLSLDYHFDINPLGKFYFKTEAGKIWGQVPFLLLKLHEGNETYVFDNFSYNLMNYYEFASDKYLGLYAEQHFQGFFMNKIPLVRKLKLRELIYAKALVGTLSENNNQNAILDFPNTLSDVTKPYIEAGFGFENIFKIIRLDAIWRLSHLDNPNIAKFGVRFSFQFSI